MHRILACFTIVAAALFAASEAYGGRDNSLCHTRSSFGRRSCIYDSEVYRPPVRRKYGSLDDYQNVALCFILNARRDVRCVRSYYEEFLRERESNWRIPLKNDSYVSAIGVKLDDGGNAFVAMIDSQRLRYMIFDLDFKVLADLDYGRVDRRYKQNELIGIRVGDKFCLAEVDRNVYPYGHGESNGRVVNECINVTEYVDDTCAVDS